MKREIRTLEKIAAQGSLATPEEVAMALRVSTPSVYGWATAGKIPSIRLSSQTLRFDPLEIKAFVDAKKAESRQPERVPQ